MNWKGFVTDYLHFTRKERIAIIVIILLILVIFFLPQFFSKSSKTKKMSVTDTAWARSIKKLEQKEPEKDEPKFRQDNEDNSYVYQYDRSKSNYDNPRQGELFYFDPNTITTEGWQKLGLRDKTIHTIQNYLSKGGHFRKPEDLQRIYGLFPNEYERIATYIKIEPADETNSYKETDYKKSNENQPAKTFAPRYSTVEINLADTTAFIALPGIGSKLATRIINFRDKLGGFYSITQVGETFGLPDSTFQKIKQYLKLDNTSIKKINLNKTTIDELKAHPYIRYNLANPIIAYRNEHGAFTKVEDLKKLMVMTDEIYNKIAPYLYAQ